jgi:hypothetical protein
MQLLRQGDATFSLLFLDCFKHYDTNVGLRYGVWEFHLITCDEVFENVELVLTVSAEYLVPGGRTCYQPYTVCASVTDR